MSNRCFRSAFCFVLTAFLLSSEAFAQMTCSHLFKKSHTVVIWSSLEDQYVHSQTRFVFGKNSPTPEILDDVEIHPENRAFYERMGFRLRNFIDAQSLSGEARRLAVQQAMPSLGDWVRNVEAMLREGLIAWNLQNPDKPLQEGDLIYPGFAFYNPESKIWLALKYGEEVPEGFIPFHETGFRTVFATGLYAALSNGLFPLMLTPNSLQHDMLGHFVSFLTNFDYVVAYKNLIQRMQDQGGYHSLNPLQRKRLLFFNEYLTIVPPEAISRRIHYFHLPDTPPAFGTRGFSKEQIAAVIETRPDAEILQSAMGFLGLADSITRRLGGASSEPSFRGRHLETSLIRLEKYMEELEQLDAGLATQLLSQDVARPLWQKSRNSLVQTLAQLESTLLVLSATTIDDWANGVFHTEELQPALSLLGWSELLSD